ncbi:hypothetical protein [Mycolicibacterium grossiae]|uniref:hypothetical protein n=1 Tax=Mycolicibacterium grossiae TaxID=1552759 RepID=UPI000F794E31|nr:hypothetical protein [Mycolicibacterium grossiae]QEM47237.1 hypothetical protein FZ046_22875 [Mycolicibacterium grossiae]
MGRGEGPGDRRRWQRLWCVPQRVRDRGPLPDWDRLQRNAIGGVWGRDDVAARRHGVDGRVAAWSPTIVAELTR